MILATHAIVGAVFGRFFPKSPLLAFLAGFISHFLIDAIPHWGYPLKSFTRDKENPKDLMRADILINKSFLSDLFLITIDFIAGIVLGLYIFEQGPNAFNLSILLAALGGMLPDALQFIYFKTRIEPFKTLHRFHVWIQRNGENEILQDNHFKGFLSQASFAAAFVLIAKFIIR